MSGFRSIALTVIILLSVGVLSYALTVWQTPKPAPYKEEHSSAPAIAGQAAIGHTAPPFTVQSLLARPFNLSDFEDKTVILNFWASWCAPCVREMPILIHAVQTYPDTVLIALSSDFNAADMKKFLAAQNYPAEPDIIFAMDTDQAVSSDIYNVRSLPQTFVIAPGGKIIAHFKGADWDPADLTKHLESL